MRPLVLTSPGVPAEVACRRPGLIL